MKTNKQLRIEALMEYGWTRAEAKRQVEHTETQTFIEANYILRYHLKQTISHIVNAANQVFRKRG